MKYSVQVAKYFDTIYSYPRKVMSTKFTSLERLTARVGVSTVIVGGKFLVAKPRDIDRGIDHVTDLAYQGEAAVFGEEDTACKGYAYCLEDYFKPMFRGRVLVIKGDECEDDDTSYADCEAYRERSAEKSILEKRPPTNFSVNLRGLSKSLAAGDWPKSRVDSTPNGEYCFLLVHPSSRDPKEVRETYTRGCEALKKYDPESYREDRYFAWSARYRGAAEGFCPPLNSGDRGYFFTHLRKHLYPALKNSKKTEYEINTAAGPVVDSDDEFEDALSPPEHPEGRGFLGYSQTKAGNIVKDFAPGTDPISQKLRDLGYMGKEKSHFYNLIRDGALNIADIPAAKAGHNSPKKTRSQGACSSRDGPCLDFTITTPHLVFPDYPMLRKLNKVCKRGDLDKLHSALKSPHPEWTKIDTKITKQQDTIKKWVEKYPHGELQSLVDRIAKACPVESSFVKMLSVIGSIFDLDCYNSTYSMKVSKHALDQSSDEDSD